LAWAGLRPTVGGGGAAGRCGDGRRDSGRRAHNGGDKAAASSITPRLAPPQPATGHLIGEWGARAGRPTGLGGQLAR